MFRSSLGKFVVICLTVSALIPSNWSFGNSNSPTILSLTHDLPTDPGSSRIVVGDPTFLRPTYGSWKQSKNVYQAVLPPCKISPEPCVEKVEVREGNEPWMLGEPIKPIGHQEISFIDGNPINTWQGSANDLLPPGSEPFLWNLHKKHSGGSTYQVTAMFQKIKGDPGAGQFNLGILGLTDSQDSASCSKSGGIFLAFKSDISPTDAQTGICPIHFDLPQDVEFKVTINFGYLANYIIGWVDSHTLNPNLEISGQSISFSGKSIKTFVMASPVFTFNQIKNDKKLCDLYNCDLKIYNGDFIETMGSFIKYWKGNEQNWTALYRIVPSVLDNKSLQEVSTWGFSSSQYKVNTSCKSAQGIMGIISTNATIYNPSPPKWNQSELTLSFEASAPHFQSDGKIVNGYYAVRLDSSLAKCLWKSDLNNAKAELEVLYQDGTSSVSTTTLSSKDSWVNFESSNFHYSSPTFKARLMKDISPSPAPKTSIITCKKGKIVKNVSGINPKCPKGFVKS